MRVRKIGMRLRILGTVVQFPYCIAIVAVLTVVS